ncbi:SPOR domain-containing protein [Teredinibacter franksiae]|uniref:SPOR domain-containing protein n=1 Tax=Teredinibacter franksiae TaxID=2761453 RepID=UPI0016237C25|nr:SPOR domain-containing protein [Teredinibacter franksiae]
MRWIFLSLLFLNLVALAWGVVFKGGAEAVVSGRPAPFAYKHVEQLELLSESGLSAGQAMVREPVKGAKALLVQVPTKDGVPLCEMVGPFGDAELAADFVERLAAMDVDSEIKELELPAGTRYQIYLPPADSRKSALRKLSELQAKKVDSYIIPKGELENGISLGMFSREDLSKEHMRAMEAIGLQPETNIIERTYWEIWTMLAQGEGGKMSSFAWARVMEGINDLERRQNFCLDVASQDNIH